MIHYLECQKKNHILYLVKPVLKVDKKNKKNERKDISTYSGYYTGPLTDQLTS